MKVLYTSVYRDGTGYANAALEGILACEAGGLDVVCRPISLSPPRKSEEPERVAHLEKKDLDGIEAVIQHTLPHVFEYRGGVRNIGIFSWETSHFRGSTWAAHCNLMDEIWASCLQSRQAMIDSGVKVPIRVMPHACDVGRFQRPEGLNIPALKDKLVFYTVGEAIRRKNLAGLLRAYFSAFSSRDDVALLIKTNIGLLSAEQAEKQVAAIVAEIRKSVHIYPSERSYPPVVIITKHLSREALDRIHATGHVFVMPSHGESWCMPAVDAMGFGNPVIASNWGSFPDVLYDQAKDYFNPRTQTFLWPGMVNPGWLLPGNLTPCFAPDSAFPNIYTGDERWFEPDLDAFVNTLRTVYGDTASLPEKSRYASARAWRFSHANVGAIMKQALGA